MTISNEVSDRPQAEHALLESEARLRRSEQHLKNAQRLASTGSIERDFTTGDAMWSDELYRILGVPRDFPRSFESFLTLVHEEDRAGLAASMRAVADMKPGTQLRPNEYRIFRPNGEIRVIQPIWQVIFDDRGKATHLIAALRDVTELRTAEARQREIEQQLLHSQKLEALGTLAGGIAHELNNTLVPVLALAKLTKRSLPEGGREHANLVTISRAAERARDLVQQIVAFSRKDAPKRVTLDLAELVSGCLKLLTASLPSTIQITEAIDEVPPISGDPSQLHQVVVNLVVNAAQAIGNGMGTIAVMLTDIRACAGDPAMTPFIRLSVRDTGCGMDEATRQRIFEPFFTTKPVGEGTGLGLSVVHGVVVDHGGRITVQSQPGHGTCIEVFLPAER